MKGLGLGHSVVVVGGIPGTTGANQPTILDLQFIKYIIVSRMKLHHALKHLTLGIFLSQL